MAEVVYILCASMSLTCTVLLFQQFRKTRSKLLLWSSLCFVFLAINNLILFVDMVVMPEVDIAGPFLRNLAGSLAGCLLLFGLIWELT